MKASLANGDGPAPQGDGRQPSWSKESGLTMQGNNYLPSRDTLSIDKFLLVAKCARVEEKKIRGSGMSRQSPASGDNCPGCRSEPRPSRENNR